MLENGPRLSLAAPADASPEDPRARVLERAERYFGFVPSLLEEISCNPPVAEMWLGAMIKLQNGALAPAEQHVVMLAALHRQDPPADPRGRALAEATWKIMDQNGWLDESHLSEFRRAGIDRRQLYEIMSLIGIATVANYVNHLHGSELDVMFLAGEPAPQRTAMS
jgi:hypothetical protein